VGAVLRGLAGAAFRWRRWGRADGPAA
jgi:hypothetical protein